jgi:hypothetical protein
VPIFNDVPQRDAAGEEEDIDQEGADTKGVDMERPSLEDTPEAESDTASGTRIRGRPHQQTLP